MAKRISVINFKGGVGKTTLAFHLGAGLAAFHDKRVLLVDMDHQSSLSIVCLGLDRWQELVNSNKTVNEIFETRKDQSHSVGNEIIVKSPVRQHFWDYTSGMSRNLNYNKLDIAPASLSLDNTEINLDLTAFRQDSQDNQDNETSSEWNILMSYLRSEWNKRTLICRWIEESSIDDEYDYIIFDCPPATKIVAQNAIAASHGYIIPVVPEAVMERGAPHLDAMIRNSIGYQLKMLAAVGNEVGEIRPMYVRDTQLVGLAITRIQVAKSGYTNDHEEHLRSLQNRWGDSLLRPYILQGTGVSSALAVGRPVYSRERIPDWSQNIEARGIHKQFMDITAEIKRRVDAL